MAGQCLRMNAATLGLVSFIDEAETFATRFADLPAGEDERFARASLMFSNLPLNTGESDDRERAPCPMHLARKTQQVPNLKSPRQSSGSPQHIQRRPFCQDDPKPNAQTRGFDALTNGHLRLRPASPTLLISRTLRELG